MNKKLIQDTAKNIVYPKKLKPSPLTEYLSGRKKGLKKVAMEKEAISADYVARAATSRIMRNLPKDTMSQVTRRGRVGWLSSNAPRPNVKSHIENVQSYFPKTAELQSIMQNAFMDELEKIALRVNPSFAPSAVRSGLNKMNIPTAENIKRGLSSMGKSDRAGLLKGVAQFGAKYSR